MWLQNVNNGRYYPYNEFLEQHYGMIRVYDNPFSSPEKKIRKETVEEAEERIFAAEEPEEEVETEVEEVSIKPPIKKGKAKK